MRSPEALRVCTEAPASVSTASRSDAPQRSISAVRLPISAAIDSADCACVASAAARSASEEESDGGAQRFGGGRSTDRAQRLGGGLRGGDRFSRLRVRGLGGGAQRGGRGFDRDADLAAERAELAHRAVGAGGDRREQVVAAPRQQRDQVV